ncbi:MAG: ABC transporter ATP-binding protein [Chthoniobacterales bacterium]|nr:ABC transporter ATP-binding protein [Chthoniobacterales bacterium]
MSTPMLQATDVRAGYGAEDILRGIGFELRAGEVLGVVGPNGSGKSTLLRALTGLIPLRAGSVLINGTNLSELGSRQRARLCAVQPQVEAPLFDYTVEEFVLLGRHPHRGPLTPPGTGDISAVKSALEHTDLENLGRRSIRSLSTGEWQRALLARALAQDAPLLLLDEPAAHLDPGHRHATHVLLQQLSRGKNLAVLCISHDLNLAAEFCDRMMILSHGEIRALGTPEDVMTEQLLQDVFRCSSLRLAANPFTGRPGTVFSP